MCPVICPEKKNPLPALLCTVDVKDGFAQFVLYILFYVFLLSLFTRITSALFIYDKRTLLDIGHRCTNLLQDTLSTDPFLFYGWTEQPRPEKPKVVECVS